MDTQPAQPTGDAARDAAAAAVAPDALTATLLAKHSAGEKLTPSEYGKIGGFASRLKRFFGGKDGAAPESPERTASPGDAARVASVAAGEAPPAALVDAPYDAGFVQRTTDSLLTRLESIARAKLGSAAGQAVAGLPADVANKTLARFDRAACIPRDDKKLMVDVSPDVAASLGINPRSFPVTVFFGYLGLWGTDIWLAVQELKAIRVEKADLSTPPAAASTPAVLPTPARPKNAPPEIMAAK